MDKSMPLVQENPGPKGTGPGRPKGSGVGRRPHTITRLKQLQDNPGVWFVWVESTYQSPTGVWSTLLGVGPKEVDPELRRGSCWQVAVRKQDNGKYKKYVRYIGENREYL